MLPEVYANKKFLTCSSGIVSDNTLNGRKNKSHCHFLENIFSFRPPLPDHDQNEQAHPLDFYSGDGRFYHDRLLKSF
jgi:hypothetical protein